MAQKKNHIFKTTYAGTMNGFLPLMTKVQINPGNHINEFMANFCHYINCMEMDIDLGVLDADIAQMVYFDLLCANN